MNSFVKASLWTAWVVFGTHLLWNHYVHEERFRNQGDRSLFTMAKSIQRGDPVLLDENVRDFRKHPQSPDADAIYAYWTIRDEMMRQGVSAF